MAVEFDAAAQLLQLIDKARGNHMLKMAGLGEVLDALQSYVEGQELRWSCTNANLQGLAAIMLEWHYGREALTRAQYEGLVRLAQGTVTVEPAPGGDHG